MSKIKERGISSPTTELTIEGPMDSFNEEYSTNISLIKKRIKKDLIIKELNIGKYTKTKIGIVYIKSIAHKELANKIEKSLKNIKIDAIIDSSYLKKYLTRNNPFPTILSTERPDKTSMALLEGKIVIVVDNSPFVLILPNFFQDFFHTTDDYYLKPFHASWIRIIRLMAFIISIYTPAVYLATTTRDYNLLPLSLLLTLKAGRTAVPFPAYIEAIMMILSFEILKEGDLRKTNASSSSISILGGLILGDAAVAAGIVSPIMIIVIAISSISGLIFPSVEFTYTIRYYKLLNLILSAFLGIYGIILGTIILLIDLLNTKIYGFNYLTFNKNELSDYFVRIPTKVFKRNKKLTNNIKRGEL